MVLAALATTVCGGTATDFGSLPQVGVPTDPPALYRWLEAREYGQFAKESAAHPSAGPHAVRVITYLNRALEESMRAGSSRHPVGAAAVKELFGGNGALEGWAVMIKLYEDRAGGDAWYWYEVTSRSASRATDPNYAGVGLGVCTGCHGSGRDFVRIPFPLR
jgi:hypothetical protein